ncbi:hypothetical protein [Streptacidiphilus jeojiensis]
MAMQQDKDARCDAPVVSLSRGDTCVFRFGNTETRGEPSRFVSYGVPKR